MQVLPLLPGSPAIDAGDDATNLLNPGSAAITVFNPAPGEGLSAGLTLTITRYQVYLPSVAH